MATRVLSDDAAAEVEMVQAIYGEGVTAEGCDVWMVVNPHAGGTDGHGSQVRLHATLPSTYPLGGGRAVVRVCEARSVDASTMAAIGRDLDRLTTTAASAGVPCLYDAYVAVQELLSAEAVSTPCVVCWEALGGGQPVVKLPTCGHAFHAPCLFPWFKVQVDAVMTSPAALDRQRLAASALAHAAAGVEHHAAALRALHAADKECKDTVAACDAALVELEAEVARGRERAGGGGGGGGGKRPVMCTTATPAPLARAGGSGRGGGKGGGGGEKGKGCSSDSGPATSGVVQAGGEDGVTLEQRVAATKRRREAAVAESRSVKSNLAAVAAKLSKASLAELEAREVHGAHAATGMEAVRMVLRSVQLPCPACRAGVKVAHDLPADTVAALMAWWEDGPGGGTDSTAHGGTGGADEAVAARRPPAAASSPSGSARMEDASTARWLESCGEVGVSLAAYLAAFRVRWAAGLERARARDGLIPDTAAC